MHFPRACTDIGTEENLVELDIPTFCKKECDLTNDPDRGCVKVGLQHFWKNLPPDGCAPGGHTWGGKLSSHPRKQSWLSQAETGGSCLWSCLLLRSWATYSWLMHSGHMVIPVLSNLHPSNQSPLSGKLNGFGWLSVWFSLAFWWQDWSSSAEEDSDEGPQDCWKTWILLMMNHQWPCLETNTSSMRMSID